jgi:hypothetical protein
MASPLTFMTRLVRPARPAPVVGRCAVCRDDVLAGSPALHLRGMHVHSACATYRMRQRARLR